MAIVGCSYFKGGIYNNNEGVITYSSQAVIAKLVRMNIDLEESDDNEFRADNGVDETDTTFAGGNYEVVTNDLTDEMSALILGLQQNTLGNISGITDTGVKEIVFDDRQNAPYMGVGNVVKHKRNGVYYYKAIVLTKIQFKTPAESWETQGKTITWQTPTIRATIMKDDSEHHMWKRVSTFTTEAQAIAYINAMLPSAG